MGFERLARIISFSAFIVFAVAATFQESLTSFVKPMSNFEIGFGIFGLLSLFLISDHENKTAIEELKEKLNNETI